MIKFRKTETNKLESGQAFSIYRMKEHLLEEEPESVDKH